MKAISIETMEEYIRLQYVRTMIKDVNTLEACLSRINEIEKAYNIECINNIIFDKESEVN